MGAVAAAASSEKRLTTAGASGRGRSQDPLAASSPSRNLSALVARNGVGAQLMKKAVAQLDQSDMIAIAAYVGSRP